MTTPLCYYCVDFVRLTCPESSAGPRESKTRSKLQKNDRMSQGLNPSWTKRIFRFQMLRLDQRNLLIICGRNFIYNNAAGSNCFLGLAHGPALLERLGFGGIDHYYCLHSSWLWQWGNLKLIMKLFTFLLFVGT